MPVRRSSIVLAVIGIVVIVLGVLVRFVVVPVATKLAAPSATRKSRRVAGPSHHQLGSV